MKKKILILGDLHFGESRSSGMHPGIIRQNSSRAAETLENLIPKFKSLKPDLLVHLGDAVRDRGDKEFDSPLFLKALSLIEQTNLETRHVVGNHDLRIFPQQELKTILEESSGQKELFGVEDFANWQLIYLDMSLDRNRKAYLPKESIDWLQTLDKNKPSIIFSHQSLINVNSKGTFFFEDDPASMCYENYQAIEDALADLNIKLCLNGHLHFLAHQKVLGRHYISCPAFSENIAAEEYPENHPGVYSILELDDKEFVFTVHSGRFCFAKIQGSF